MRKSCTGEEVRGEGNQHKIRVHDVWGSCHATVMLCLAYLGLVAAVDVTTLRPQASACLPCTFQNITITNKLHKLHKLHKKHKLYKHDLITHISYISSPLRIHTVVFGLVHCLPIAQLSLSHMIASYIAR